MSIWQQERTGRERRPDSPTGEGSRPAFDLGGDEFCNWVELQSSTGSGLLDMKDVLNHVYAYARPLRRRSKPNTMLVLAAGALGVLALRRSRQRGLEGVQTND